MTRPLLEIRNLRVAYRRDSAWIPAVRDVSLAIRAGEFYGLVGESGCGKSTLALACLGLLPASEAKTEGEFLWHGRRLGPERGAWKKLRGPGVGMVFQDPFSSLNPVFTVRRLMEETLEVHGRPRDAEHLRRALEEVGLPVERTLRSYPHQLSGGMRQRTMIALALLLSPELLLLDEPTSALDATVQKEILELLDRLRKERGLAMLFITHNLALLSGRADRIAVMYAGRIAEEGPAERILANPRHPYSAALLECGRMLSRRKVPSPIPGGVPSPENTPPGCAFHPRCPRAAEECRREDPGPTKDGAGYFRCFHPHPPLSPRRGKVGTEGRTAG